MGRVRVFYGHEGVVPPTGLRSRSAVHPASDEVDEVVSDDVNGEEVQLVGEVVEDGAEVATGAIERVDGTEVPVGDDGVPVLTEDDEVVDDEDADAESEDDAEDEGDDEDAAPALPDESWTKGDLLAFAEENGIDMTGAKKTQPLALARILETLKEK